jgi:hypothetical protein
MTERVKLVAVDGYLMAGDAILLRVYDAGDCDSCPWPMVSDYSTEAQLRERLAIALYDAREMGDIPSDAHIVLLPNDEPFHFDEELIEAEAGPDEVDFDESHEAPNEDRDYGVRANETDEFYARNDAGEYINRM